MIFYFIAEQTAEKLTEEDRKLYANERLLMAYSGGTSISMWKVLLPSPVFCRFSPNR